MTCIVGINVWHLFTVLVLSFEFIISFCTFFPDLKTCEVIWEAREASKISVSITVSFWEPFQVTMFWAFQRLSKARTNFLSLGASKVIRRSDWVVAKNHQHQPERHPIEKKRKTHLSSNFFTVVFLGIWGFSCPNNYVSRELGILLHSQKHHQEWISEVVMPKCNGGELFEFLANETEAWKLLKWVEYIKLLASCQQYLLLWLFPIDSTCIFLLNLSAIFLKSRWRKKSPSKVDITKASNTMRSWLMLQEIKKKAKQLWDGATF